MRDDRAERVADILTGYSVPVKEGDLVTIRGAHVAEPLLLALYRRCLERGAHPILRASLPQAESYFYRFAGEQQLEFVWESERWMIENIDASFSIISETNTRQLSRIDPEKQAIFSRSRQPLMDRYFERNAAGEASWNLTLYPTEAHAQDAQMSLAEYEDFFYGACLVDSEDPISEWTRVAERHERLIEWMSGRNLVHVEGEGTDLLLEVGGRQFVSADGKENFPDGEIFTGPLEDRTSGHITFSYPALYGGHAVEGIQLTFESGRVVEARADKDEDFLVKTLDTDPGGRVVGELGIGTNFGIESFTGELLLDEKIGGTVHLALGASYPETGGINKSAIHWDMVCDLRRGGRVTVDDDVLMEDGRLLVPN
jgi:aminopeptidase